MKIKNHVVILPQKEVDLQQKLCLSYYYMDDECDDRGIGKVSQKISISHLIFKFKNHTHIFHIKKFMDFSQKISIIFPIFIIILYL